MKFAALLFILCLLSLESFGAPQQEAAPAHRGSEAMGAARPPEGPSCNFVTSREKPGYTNVIISDGDERVVSGVFSVDQLKILRGIMEEAKGFSATEEAVGTREPLTTRFSSHDDPSFFVDVAKFKTQSEFYITLTADTGQITIFAGAINRTRSAEPVLFFDILSRLNVAISRIPPVKPQ